MSDLSKEQQDRIIEKVRNLFKLAANDGAAAQEAETAMRMANALLTKHAIGKHQLHQTEEVFASFMDYPIKSQDWIKNVCSAICKLYSCRVVFDYNWGEQPKTLIIGTGSNRLTAVIVIDHLIDQIRKETKGEKVAYKRGAALGLNDVVIDILAKRADSQEEAMPGTGIMVLEIDERNRIAVDDFVSEQFPNLSRGRAKSYSAEGRAYGRGLNPGARVSGAGQKRLN